MCVPLVFRGPLRCFQYVLLIMCAPPPLVFCGPLRWFQYVLLPSGQRTPIVVNVVCIGPLRCVRPRCCSYCAV